MGKYVHAGVGISKVDDPGEAGKECVQTAFEKLKQDGGKNPGFAIVFCSGGKYGKNDKTIKKFVESVDSALRELNPEIKWVGCTTAGEISNYGITFESAVCALIESEYIRWGVGFAEGVKEKPFETGKKAAKKALNDLKVDKYLDAYISFQLVKKKPADELIKNRQFVILILNPGFTLKESGWEDKMLEGIKEVVGAYTPIVGGSAADDLRLIKNYQFVNGKVSDNLCVCTAIYSNLKIGYGISHGFVPTEKIGIISDAERNIIKKINNKPALDVYAEFLNVEKDYLASGFKMFERFKSVPLSLMKIANKLDLTGKMLERFKFMKFIAENPLGIPDIHGIYWIKVVNNYKEDGSLILNSSVEKNLPVALMKLDENAAILATSNSIDESCKDFNPKILFIFECAGRIFLLGKEKIFKSYGVFIDRYSQSSIIGYYTGAEIGLTKKMPSGVHSYTCASLAIGDKLILE